MVQANELIMFIISCMVVFFVFLYRAKIKGIVHYRLLCFSFGFFFFSSLFTILEDFFLSELLNSLEHINYLFSSFFLFWWTLKFARYLRTNK